MTAPLSGAPAIKSANLDINTFLGVIWGGVAIAVIFVIFRIFARLKVCKKIFADDVLVILALTMAIASATILQTRAKNMFDLMAVASGRHSEIYLKPSLALFLLFYSTLWAIKISVLIFFKRLGKNVGRHKTLWWLVFGFTLATYIACISTIQYPCFLSSPDSWANACTTPSSIKFQQTNIKLNCTWDVSTDILIMLIPISMFWGLQMKLRRKILLISIFSLVIITVIIAIVRATMVGSATHVLDTTWRYMWSVIETTVAIIVSCLASFRGFFSPKDSRTKPLRHKIPTSQILILQGSNNRRNRPRDSLDALTSFGFYATFVHSDDSESKIGNLQDVLSNIPVPLQAVHMKRDVEMVHEPV